MPIIIAAAEHLATALPRRVDIIDVTHEHINQYMVATLNKILHVASQFAAEAPHHDTTPALTLCHCVYAIRIIFPGTLGDNMLRRGDMVLQHTDVFKTHVIHVPAYATVRACLDASLGREFVREEDLLDMYLVHCVHYLTIEILGLAILAMERRMPATVSSPLLILTPSAVNDGIETDPEFSKFVLKWNILEFITCRLMIPRPTFRKIIDTVYKEFDSESRACLAYDAVTHLQTEVETRVERLLHGARKLMQQYGRRKLTVLDLDFIKQLDASTPQAHMS